MKARSSVDCVSYAASTCVAACDRGNLNWRQRFPDDGFKREVAGGGTAGGEWVKFAAYAARQRRRADE